MGQNVLESGSKKRKADRTMSMFLSKKLGRRRHGLEYGALEVKNHLERLLFSDIVSTVMIMLVFISLLFALLLIHVLL
jgi:DNA-directed RNA polymerase-4 subunit 1